MSGDRHSGQSPGADVGALGVMRSVVRDDAFYFLVRVASGNATAYNIEVGAGFRISPDWQRITYGSSPARRLRDNSQLPTPNSQSDEVILVNWKEGVAQGAVSLADVLQ